MANVRNLALLMLTAACLANIGCAKGPISATNVHLARFAPQADQRAGEQVLAVDLPTGRASLTDVDGSTYPTQLPPNLAEQWRQAVTANQWQVPTIRAASKVPAAELRTYELSVFDGQAKVGRTVRWTLPPAKPLPAPLELFTRTFERIDRMANPLSRDVNLLE